MPEEPNADIKIVVVHTPSVVMWLLNLFDPPPLASMTFTQKVGRVILLSSTLVIGSVLVAMLGALGLYLLEKGREIGNTPEFFSGISVILVGIAVNTLCIAVLLQIKRADHKLVPPKVP
jgi:ABC-type Fe3+-siderophore transport system permease subunit